MNDGSRGANPGHRPIVDPSTTDSQRLARQRARARLAEQDRRCRIARMADELMPMAVYYRTRRGRWAA